MDAGVFGVHTVERDDLVGFTDAIGDYAEALARDGEAAAGAIRAPVADTELDAWDKDGEVLHVFRPFRGSSTMRRFSMMAPVLAFSVLRRTALAELPAYLRTIVEDHVMNYPDSDLVDVLTEAGPGEQGAASLEAW